MILRLDLPLRGHFLWDPHHADSVEEMPNDFVLLMAVVRQAWRDAYQKNGTPEERQDAWEFLLLWQAQLREYRAHAGR